MAEGKQGSHHDPSAPEVVGRGSRWSGRLLFVVGLAVVLVVGAVAFVAGRSSSDEAQLEAMIGRDHTPFQLVAQELIGGQEWKVYAYKDQEGRPCLVETLGGGGCYPHAGKMTGEIGDYGVSGESAADADGTVEYVVVMGAVPLSVKSVVVEFDDGTRERTEALAFPGFEERMFAILREGSFDREVVAVEAGRL